MVCVMYVDSLKHSLIYSDEFNILDLFKHSLFNFLFKKGDSILHMMANAIIDADVLYVY